MNVLVLEIDGDRRRLSLSLKRVEEGAVPVPRADGGTSVHSMPDLRLSEEAFPSSGAVAEDAEPVAGSEDELVEATLVVEEAEETDDEVEVDEPEVEAAEEADAEPEAEAVAEPEVEAVAEADEPEAEAVTESEATEADAEPEPEPEADSTES